MNEMEIIRHSRVSGITVFLNSVDYRTPHFHSEWELIWILDQPLLVNSGGKTIQAEPGEFLLFAPGQPHEFQRTEKASTFLCIQVSQNLLELDREWIPVSFSLGKGEGEWGKTAIEIAKSYLLKESFHELLCRGKTLILFHQIFSSVSLRNLSIEEHQQSEKRNKRLSRLIQYVDENYMHKVTLSEFAEAEGFSMSYLSHFVKENLNQSFQEYVTSVRINAACKLMASGNQKLTDISNEAGFSDYRYFSKAFKKQFGMTPEQYRVDSAHPRSALTHHSIHSLERFYTDEESMHILNRLETGKIDQICPIENG